MFIEFETLSGHTTLNVRHIVQIKKSDIGDHALLILVNGEKVEVNPPYQDVCEQLARAIEIRQQQRLSTQEVKKSPA
jgi:hypothetical protein